MTDHTEDVREIAEDAVRKTINDIGNHDQWLSPRARRLVADAVLSAVTPVIRQQEREEIRRDLAEKIELRRRAASETARDRESDIRQQVYSNGQTTTYQELANRLERYFAERTAVARSHAQPEERTE